MEALDAAGWYLSDGNMVATGNIYDYTQHYLHLPINGCWNFPAGYNEISIIASNHTDALPREPAEAADAAQLGIVTVLAENGVGRNLMRVQVLPVGATCSGG